MTNNTHVKMDIVVCGASCVGKTSFVLRATGKNVPDNYVRTIGVDFNVFKCKLENKQIGLHIWDLAGEKRYERITKAFYERAHLILLCFDVSEPNTFKHLKSLVHRIDEMNKKHKKIILGIKNDKTNQVKNIETYATLINASYYEVSTLDELECISVIRNIAKEGLKKGLYRLDIEDEKIVDTDSCCYM